MYVLGQHVGTLAAWLTGVGGAVAAIAAGAVVLYEVRENACDALLWTIQRDLFAARQMQTQAIELGPQLEELEAVTMNKQVLKSARESIEIFEQKREEEKAECGR